MTSPALAENVKGKGRHYRDPRSDELVPSVTNVLGVLNKPALPRWAAIEVARKAWELRLSLPAMDEADAIDVLKGSPWRKSTRAADRGTTIHSYLEAVLAGTRPDVVTGEAALYRDAADAWVDWHKPSAVHLERTVFGDGYAGTADAWLKVDGELWLVDFKTSKAIYPEAALQLAALAAAPLMAVGTEVVEAPIPARLAVVRIGLEGEHETRFVADPMRELDAFMAALEVWHWMNGEGPYSAPISLAEALVKAGTPLIVPTWKESK